MQGRIQICEGKNIDMVLDEEIRELTEKLQKLQKISGVKDSEGTRKNRNFDKRVSALQRRLEKIGGSSDEIYLREFQEMANISLSVKTSSRFDDTVVARGKVNVSNKGSTMFLLLLSISIHILNFDCSLILPLELLSSLIAMIM